MGGGGGGGGGEMEVRKRFAVLLCAEDSEYVKKVYGGYFKVFVGLLGEEGEIWEVYRAARGELPAEEDVDAYDGFVITGSCNDAHGDDLWIKELLKLLKIIDSKRKKVLGICFGHQILSRALGGKTGRAKGWDVGVTCIHPSQSALKLLSSLHIPSHLPVIECHRDEVWELPPLAEVMAWSEKTGIEMFRYGDHIMGIQGHPEYTKEILLHLIDRLLQRNLIQICHAEAAKASLDAREPEREAWKRLCKSFLKGKL
ncbi:gamma-glutamyl peptidase 5-like [Phoenix dactylifera]|uniref:Gamma-glutamyl peptidase 5-like n=1 Tax=Phoenix dactylifera TaxID=42345 RepID=A0A8B7C8M6_PHODC|nr:gamma-glutamyl peptidase 5-like [Phoenix dactylifera]